ncbi:hypothetical protein [Nonomuraea coxensis]|nr:hypothetical protein [Nonomuraea coxensis]
MVAADEHADGARDGAQEARNGRACRVGAQLVIRDSTAPPATRRDG